MRCIDDEIPFEIPEGWEWCRLGAIGSWGSGATPSKGHPEFYGGSIPWLTTGELNESYVFDTKVKVTEKALACCSLRKCATGDVLIAMYGATIGKVAIAGCELTTNQACCACTPYYNYNKYLFYFLMSNKLNFIKMGEGGAQPNISKEKIIATLCPLPPHNEQRRIVEVVEFLIPKIEHFSTLQVNLEELNTSIFTKLRKSILQEAIQGRLVPQDPADEPASVLLERIREEKLRLIKEGKLKKKDITDSVIFKGEDNKYYEKIGKEVFDITEEIPFDIPDSWCWCRLGTVFQHNTGKALNRADQKGSLLTYITTSNLYWDRFELDNLRQMYFTDEEISKCTVQKGDLLVCEGGDIGRAAIWPFEKPVRIQNHIHRLRPYSTINTRFFYYTMAHFKDSGVIGGTGIGIQSLSSGALHQLLLPIPPLDEQYRVVEKMDKTLASIMRG